MQKNGKSRKRASLMLSMDLATKERLRKLAEQRHMTISAMITSYCWQQRLPESAQDEAE